YIMENSITNTLFRLVSYRAPEKLKPPIAQLLYTSEKLEIQTGVFFDTVRNRPAGTSKAEAMANAATEFEAEAITTESQIREINPELFDFADWLISNRTNYTNEELLQRVEGIRPLNENIGGELQKVWNNVFYQTTSQKSFELKES